jgi:hypothetical protein
VAKGPLPEETEAAIRAAFHRHGDAWEGQI